MFCGGLLFLKLCTAFHGVLGMGHGTLACHALVPIDVAVSDGASLRISIGFLYRFRGCLRSNRRSLGFRGLYCGCF